MRRRDVIAGLGTGSTEVCSEPREEHCGGERLDHVVGGAGVQADHDVDVRVTSRDHDDR